MKLARQTLLFAILIAFIAILMLPGSYFRLGFPHVGVQDYIVNGARYAALFFTLLAPISLVLGLIFPMVSIWPEKKSRVRVMVSSFLMALLGFSFWVMSDVRESILVDQNYFALREFYQQLPDYGLSKGEIKKAIKDEGLNFKSCFCTQWWLKKVGSFPGDPSEPVLWVYSPVLDSKSGIVLFMDQDRALDDYTRKQLYIKGELEFSSK